MARKLTAEEVKVLEKNGCQSGDWNAVSVGDGFHADRVQHCRFIRSVMLGSNTGTLSVNGVAYPCGISNAVLADTTVSDNVVIRNIGTHILNYTLEAETALVNVAELSCTADTTFGQGIEVDTLNEAGGREVPLSSALTAQTAFLITVYRHRPALVNGLVGLIKEAAEKTRGQKGIVGRGARLLNTGTVRNVLIGPGTQIQGAASLQNGTIVSCPEDPVIIGEGVTAEAFVILEGAHVTSQAVLNRVFVGQGTRIGKQFSAENSLFFANCEGFHGEACSVFAGPYSVSHHKSTLLIASMVSFYNAGSGTNQSNHMYKLGPVHQGILERGCKTGSFSYLMLEAHLAPFCVVIGKHMANIDIPDFPFSYLSESGGRSQLTPAMNLLTVGTIRDQEKWAARDRRKAPLKRDIINPAVYSPYTVEKMVKGRDILRKLYQETPKERESVAIGGTVLSRLLMKNSAKYYHMTVLRYLYQKFFIKVEHGKAYWRRFFPPNRPIGIGSTLTGAFVPERPLKRCCPMLNRAP
jgi:hypothetical protein